MHGTLEDLVVDVVELDCELVRTVLLNYIRIDRTTGEVIPLAAWDNTRNEVRIILYLLARRAIHALGLPQPQVAATPREIEQATGIPGGTVRPALQRLRRDRLVSKVENNGYLIPNTATSRVRVRLGVPMPVDNLAA